jgi:phosphate/sulfate permease
MRLPLTSMPETKTSLLQHSALIRIGLAALILIGLWLAIAWAISLP